MKTLYLDCSMGAAGDMLTAALLELLPDPEGFVKRLGSLGLPGVEFFAEPSVKCGVTGTHMRVAVNGEEEHEHHEHEHEHEHEHHHGHEHEHEHHHGHHHSHSSLGSIESIVASLDIPEGVRADVMAVYGLIAEAESHAHGVPVTEIHFHEVGTMDAVADVAAVCLLMDELSPDEVVVSPVHVGAGQVRCAHGILPVPAPATAYILRGVPIYGGSIRTELCTPTGAALLKHFASRFGEMPVMRTFAVGCGMGTKDLEAANCLRAFLGEREGARDEAAELSFNVDDMTAEEIGFLMERLFEAGALEVYTVPIGMKKSRPGTLVTALCREDNKEALLDVIFRHSTTIGVRECGLRRHVLARRTETVRTSFGDIRRKVSEGRGVRRVKYEYEDIARAARESGMSLREIREELDE